MKIGLIGNPNSGKTTMYNRITNSNERVGNWHGVTVDARSSLLSNKFNKTEEEIRIIDLPGCYSLNPYTSEEGVTTEFIKNEAPDVIINIIEATNLTRSLLLTVQLLQLGIPIVIGLNKGDLAVKKGVSIDPVALSEYLKCPVVLTVATGDDDKCIDSLIRECVMSYRLKRVQVAPKISGLRKVTSQADYTVNDRKIQKYIKNMIIDVEHKVLSPEVQNRQDKIDRLVTHQFFGIVIFALVMFIVFYLSQALIGPFVADWLVGVLESFQAMVGQAIEGANPFLSSLLVNGIIGGFIAVVGFLPLIMVMFFLMALMEDSGYMARVAVVMDRYFKKIGLSGKSIIPMVIGTACSIPGVMATRTIRDDKARRTTALITPFMPCGAKLPVIALFSGVFFAGNALVATSMYFLAIIVIILVAKLVRKITQDTSVSYFIIELPEYRMPSFKRATTSMFSRAKSFIIKASTIILISNVVIEILQTFTFSLTVATSADQSILAVISHPISLLMIPLGFGMWQFAAASVTGFIAKENVVGTLAVVFSISNLIDVDNFEMVAGSADSIQSVFGIGSVAGLSFLVFNLFTPPCFAAIGALRAELDSRAWLTLAIALQFLVGYTIAFIVYQLGTLLTLQTLGGGFILGLIIIFILSLIVYIIAKTKASEL